MNGAMKVLIIDDNQDDRENYVRLLKKANETGFCCCETSDGTEGLEAIGKFQPDCLLLDYSLPGANGLDVLKQIKLHNENVPVIMLTGQGSEAIAVQAMREGANDYLSKSAITADSLSRSIRMAVERRNTEVQRQKLIEKLTQSNTELERFAYVASHDMQEPVRMVINFSRILAEGYGEKLDEEGRECLKFVTESSERIHCIIDDLLEYARMEGEEQNMTLVDGAKEVQHVLENLGDLIAASGAEVTYENLPCFQGNPVQFMRLMQNLIANAIKYQPAGNIPKVHISAEDRKTEWCISIQDNGMGIDEAFTHQIFEPFRRLHSWEQIKGTGIGLAVCKKIVENHGGKIWVTSALKKGSTFFITIPKKPANGQEAA